MGRGAISMLDNLVLMILIGSVLGFLSGIGVGGGSLLMLWLTLVLRLEYTIARNINLLFFIPAALIASLFRWRQGSLNIKKILPAILCGCISATCLSFAGKHLDISILKKLFGVLLLITGLRELLYRPRKAR